MTLIPELVSGELYKEHITLMSCTPEPVIWSCDTGLQMPYFDSCQVVMTWLSGTSLISLYALDSK